MNLRDFISEVDNILVQVIEHLHNRQIGFPGPGTIEELDFIAQELSHLSEILMRGEIPPTYQRWLSSAQIVTGTWDFEEKLGEEICRIDYLYRHELVDPDLKGVKNLSGS
jgi:hypothetical protein